MYSKLSVLSFSSDRLVTKPTLIVINSFCCCFIAKREEARLSSSLFVIKMMTKNQCWTKSQSSTAVAEDLRPMVTATVAEV